MSVTNEATHLPRSPTVIWELAAGTFIAVRIVSDLAYMIASAAL